MNTSLADKWILITGASSGFGAASAIAFAKQGAKLLLGARRLEKLEEVRSKALAVGSPTAMVHRLDVASTESVSAFISWAKAQTQRVDVLLNNAGGAHGADHVADSKDADWEAMFQSNVLGLLRVTRAVLPLLPHDAGASIINVGSIAGHVAYEGGAAYCGAKAAELKITEALRLELSGTGIRVCTIDPGMAETEFSLVRFKGDTARASKVYDGVNALTAGDFAETVLWIASRPAHVNIDEIIIKPTDQAAIHKVFRRTPKK